MAEPDTIYFYAQPDPYGEFSNFAPFGVAMECTYWPTVEHYFQAMKFHDDAYRERIRSATKPKDAKALGQNRAVPLRADWDDIKDAIMYDAVRKKFETHPTPRDLLLGTGDARIVENAPADYYWGCGQDGTGLNRLGEILMQVRTDLRTNA
ncbi:DUF1768 domain-containing protein [Rhodobacterales bacterium HKCCE4037]|nr:DUF1768 domain-containing protein [Rhodobacterales bacterium HKCCE4037]